MSLFFPVLHSPGFHGGSDRGVGVDGRLCLLLLHEASLARARSRNFRSAGCFPNGSGQSGSTRAGTLSSV
jgi:hypothetical protein